MLRWGRLGPRVLPRCDDDKAIPLFATLDLLQDLSAQARDVLKHRVGQARHRIGLEHVQYSDVEDELIENIREIKKPKQQRRASSREEKTEILTSVRTKRDTPRKTEPRSTKTKILALPAPKAIAEKTVLKKVDTQDTKAPVVTPEQPKVLPQFNIAKNASLRAEIEQSLSAYSLSRNPQLNRQTTPNQKTTRFRV